MLIASAGCRSPRVARGMLLTRISERTQLACMTGKEPVLIERFDDQRFYDVALARFLTIDDLVAWHAMSLCFEVRDATTGEDVTEKILAEVLSDRHGGSSTFFPQGSLAVP